MAPYEVKHITQILGNFYYLYMEFHCNKKISNLISWFTWISDNKSYSVRGDSYCTKAPRGHAKRRRETIRGNKQDTFEQILLEFHLIEVTHLYYYIYKSVKFGDYLVGLIFYNIFYNFCSQWILQSMRQIREIVIWRAGYHEGKVFVKFCERCL